MASAGTGMSIAGCNGLLGDGEQPQAGAEGLEEGQRRVTVLVAPDPEELQSAQEDVASQVEGQNVSQQEIQSSLIEAQTEVYSSAVEEAQSEIGNTDATVEDSIPENGVLLVAGPPAALIDLLELPVVDSLYAGGDFEQVQQQQQGGQQSGQQGGQQSGQQGGQQSGE